MVIKTEETGGTRLELYPNRSASWKQVKLLMWVFASVCLCIAFSWAFVGAWLILPFAGLEVGLLIFVMYYVTQMTHRKEVVHITESHILVQSGIKAPTLSWTLNKDATKVLIMEVQHPEDPACVHLVDDSQRLELGRYLNIDDKKIMIDELKSLGLPIKNIKKNIQLII